MKEICDIQSIIGGKEFAPFEKERLAKDIARVFDRLKSGEYARHDFAGNTFDVSRRTEEFFDDFAGYVLQARTWAKILDLLKAGNFETIIDLCPGWSPKIPMALWLADFNGRLVMADKDAASMGQIARFMQFFSPRYSMEFASIDLFGAIDIKAPLVLASHIIDDIVLALAGDWMGDAPSVNYANEEALVRRWQFILADRERAIAETVPLLCKIFDRTVMPKGAAVITQYRSYMDRLMGLDEPVRLCRDIFEETAARLCASGFARNRALPHDALDGFDGYFKSDDCAVLTRAG